MQKHKLLDGQITWWRWTLIESYIIISNELLHVTRHLLFIKPLFMCVCVCVCVCVCGQLSVCSVVRGWLNKHPLMEDAQSEGLDAPPASQPLI